MNVTDAEAATLNRAIFGAWHTAPRYVATINVPGYLPQDDDPPTFDAPCDAWGYLTDERERDEDMATDNGHEPGKCNCAPSKTWETLNALAQRSTPHRTRVTLGINPDGTGTIYGPTPGHEGQHDLGLAYSVTLLTEE